MVRACRSGQGNRAGAALDKAGMEEVVRDARDLSGVDLAVAVAVRGHRARIRRTPGIRVEALGMSPGR